MEYNLTDFKEGLNELNISLNDDQFSCFLKYYEMLIETNKVMNLTAITDFYEVIKKHFLDSLSLVKIYDFTKNVNILDVGTGAGFPGIPIKIAFPNINVTLLDSLNKRVNFLNNVIDEIGLSDIAAIHGRAEDTARNSLYREKYDLVVSRAVSNLASLSEYCIPFVNVGGKFISYKSQNVDEEIDCAYKAVQILGGKISDVIKFEFYGQNRAFVVVDKIKNTPKAYPRKAGTPSRQPLGC
jgi:16S rRNA (guanine527-N7)-methyltransferase